MGLGCAAPLYAQEEFIGEFLRAIFVWSCGGFVVYLASLIAAARMVGLPGGFLRALGTVFLGGLIAIVPALLIGNILGETLGEDLSAILYQGVTLGASCVAAMVVFRTDFLRALLCVLLASIFTFVVGSVALVLIY